MSGLDWLIVAILSLSLLLAALQGFLYELFSLAGVVIGYLLAAWEYRRVAPWFLPYVKSDWIAHSVAFLLIFVFITLLAGIAGRIARSLAKEVGLRWFDRLLGAAFGLSRGALIVTVVVLALASFGPGSKWLTASQFGPYFLVIGRAATWVAPYELRERFRNGVTAVRDMRSQRDNEQAKSPK
ncbi:MAG TPA: CvpA family protein [Clostridia bacterium]|nr:CvpA family protein [Clostridia bacterium]